MNKKTLILIVDDLADNRLSVKIALKEENYIFEEASTGEEAIQKCIELKPNIILMDAMMPAMNGFKTTKLIRSMEGFSNTPILMITSLEEKSDKIEALSCGLNDFISKPFDKQELIARCRSYAIFSKETVKRKVAEEALKEKHEYLQHIINSIDDPIMVIKEDYTIDLMNTTVKNTMNSKIIADSNNPKCYEISHGRSSPCDGNEHPCPLHDVLQTKTSVKVIHNHFDTKTKYVELSASPLFNKNNECIGIIESGRDITAHINIQKELNKQKIQLDYQAHHDSLTGLSNRVIFEDRLSQAIKKVKRKKKKVALFFIDLDKFKSINDTFGHKAGDFILKFVAKSIQNIIREEDTLSRIGGDEFTLVMENMMNENDILFLAQKIQDTLDTDINFEDKTLKISASIGISICPDNSSDVEALITYADKAMYMAKENKTINTVLYSQYEQTKGV